MKKIKRLILHIGTIKSGTTSIQLSLGESREALLRHNIYYPTIKPYNHIFSFPPLFVENPDVINWFRRELDQNLNQDKNTKLQAYLEAWQKEFSACKDDQVFIISAEDLSLPYFTEDAVKRVKKFVEPYFERISVIAYIRHYDTWIVSEVQQQIQNGYTGNDDLRGIIQRLQNCPPLMSYQMCLQKWENVFGRDALIVMPFDPPLFYKQSLLADFLRACDLPVDDISIPEIRANESIGKYAVAFMVKYNQTFPIYINNKINPDRGLTQHGIPYDIYQNLKDEKYQLNLVYSPGQAQKLNREIDYVNQFFTDGYRFPYVSPGEKKTQVPSMDDIPVEFFVDLVNNYNKRIESQRIRIGKLVEQKKDLLNRNNFLKTQNSYTLKIIDMLRIPALLRTIERLPRLKRFVQKIVNWQKR